MTHTDTGAQDDTGEAVDPQWLEPLWTDERIRAVTYSFESYKLMKERRERMMAWEPVVNGTYHTDGPELIKIDDARLTLVGDGYADLQQGYALCRQVPATPSPVGASVLWSDERITNEAYEFAKKEGAHSTDAVEMIARRMRDDYEAHRGASVPSEVLAALRDVINLAEEHGDAEGYYRNELQIVRAWLAQQQRGQG